MSVRHFTAKDAEWYQYRDRQIFVGDVVDSSNSETMSVGFYRNRIKGDRNEWIVTYDEALIVTRGSLTIRSPEGAKTAKAGEVIFLTKGTKVAYEAAEEDTEVVYVTYPHRMDAHGRSEHTALLDSYHPVRRNPNGDPTMKPRTSVLGMGRMGSALARAFLKQGHKTSVWNRTKSKCEPLAALGAQVAPSVHDAVAAAEIIVVNVNDYVTSDALLRGDEVTKALHGKLLVQLTSGDPKQAKEMAEWARQNGIQYLDGAIMATPNFIGEPECTILYSGPGNLFEKYRPVLLAFGGNAVHVGSDVGHASALDSALLVVMWGAMFGMLQGVAICEAEELRLDAYMSYLKPILPQVDGWVIDTVKRIEDRRFAGDEATLATVDSHYGALRHLLELCKERGIKRSVPEAFDELFQAAIKAGHGQDDFAVLNKFMR